MESMKPQSTRSNLIKFQDLAPSRVEEYVDYGTGPVGSFLKTIDYEKVVVDNIYQNMKRDAPPL